MRTNFVSGEYMSRAEENFIVLESSHWLFVAALIL